MSKTIHTTIVSLFLLSLSALAADQTSNPTRNHAPRATPAENVPPPSSKPNVLIILADDMGYRDLASYGGWARTPHLDSLAAGGIKFTNCYAAAPNCSPSRVGLLTGRIPARSGMYSYRPAGSVMHLPDAEETIAELLKRVGYQTAHFGKWHLGALAHNSLLNHPQPKEQGFDYSFGTENNAEPSHRNPINFIRNGLPLGELPGYACQLVAGEVEYWFDEHYDDDKPFFLYVAFHEPHTTIASPDSLIANYSDYDDNAAAYYANIEHLDQAVGHILEALKEKGVEKNTLIFFASDNGPYRMGSQGELRGLKGSVYDGGIKVPGILSYSGVIEGSRAIETPIWFQDVLPTVAALSGAEVPGDRAYDGVNLLPLLAGQSIQRPQPMLWFFYRSSPEIATRMGDYVLMARTDDTLARTHWVSDIDMHFIQHIQPTHFELYQVTKDPGQRYDLAAIETETLASMKDTLRAMLADIIAESPVWDGLPPYDANKASHSKQHRYLQNRRQYLPPDP